MSVGNDVVDLDDVESRLEGLHPRWSERVFGSAERDALERVAGGERRRLHWALWAAKESAYKARKRRDPEAVFSPRELVVDLGPWPASGGVARGRVVHRGEAFALEVSVDRGLVHAVATRAGEPRARLVSRVGRAGREPSRDARRLAAEAIGADLRLPPARLELVGRPPVVRHHDRALEVCLSLSHHGRFVAFAYRVP